MTRAPRRDLSAAELARALGVTPRAPSAWAKAGCPHVGGGRQGNPLRFNRAEAEAWRAAQAESGDRPARRGKGGTDRAALRATAASRGAIDKLQADLASARTPADLAALEADAFGLGARGIIDAGVSKLVVEAVGRRRKALADEPVAVGPELLALPEDVALLEVVAGIVDGRRRAAIVAYAREQAEADALALGDVTEPGAVVARLSALGLDAFGEPA